LPRSTPFGDASALQERTMEAQGSTDPQASDCLLYVGRRPDAEALEWGSLEAGNVSEETPAAALRRGSRLVATARRFPVRTLTIGSVVLVTMVVATRWAAPRAASLLGAGRASRWMPVGSISSEEVKTMPLRGMLTMDEESNPCFTRNRAYNPIDMLGVIPLAASGPEECQERCKQQSGCKYFSFDHISMVCHLEDKWATMGPVPVLFVAGPQVCPTTTETTTTAITTTETTTLAATTAEPRTTNPTTAPANVSHAQNRTAAPKETEAATTKPSAKPTTQAPTHPATQPITRQATHPATQPPTTQPPTTQPPTTQPPTTQPPTTQPPTTQPPATQPPATQPPTTQAPDVLPALYCFMMSMTSGYEPDLIRKQIVKHAGIFNCKVHQVFSTEELDLGNGFFATKIGAAVSKKGAWGSWLNTENFLRAWDSILAEGKFRSCDWTVKADPDAVFFPDRLQLHLKQSFPGGTAGSFYIRNCPKSFGMLGSLEVFSTAAVDKFGHNRHTCREKWHPEDSGEDGYIQACMEGIGVVGKEDFSLLIDGYCGFGSCANNHWNVAFHPYKDKSSWFQCWDQVVAAR